MILTLVALRITNVTIKSGSCEPSPSLACYEPTEYRIWHFTALK